MQISALKCSSCVFYNLPSYLFPSGNEEARGECDGPASGKMEPRSPIRIEELPCDTPLGLGTDLMEKSRPRQSTE